MPEYDVIIVGAGSAGGPLAARLSENDDRQVLLLEAGDATTSVEQLPPHLRWVSDLSAGAPWNAHNWAHVVSLTPQIAYTLPRGKVMGGSSAINAAVFTRGVRQDFDEWERQGNDAWSWETVLPYFKRSETDLDFRNELHGTDGPIRVARPSGELQSPLTPAFLQACDELGFPAEQDKNAGGPPGAGLYPGNAVDGMRMSTAISYLMPALGRRNLTIRGNTFVRRVLFRANRAIGVEVETSDGQRESIYGGEVVLSAGAIKTPHLLALSGLGPAAELKSAGIDPLQDMPGVGKDWPDHPSLSVSYKVARDPGFKQGMLVPQAALTYNSGNDPAGDVEIALFVASMKEMLFGSTSGRAPSRGFKHVLRHPVAALASMRGVSIRRTALEMSHLRDMQAKILLTQEESRGQMRVRSTDPHQDLEVNYNYMSKASDLGRMRQALRTVRDILNAPALSPWIRSVVDPGQRVLSDDAALNAWILAHIGTTVHMVGTARMGVSSDDSSVVDQHLRVHGVDNLRVVDSSVMPSIPHRSVNATTVMIGERAADFF